jgi:hypothetical protein
MAPMPVAPPIAPPRRPWKTLARGAVWLLVVDIVALYAFFLLVGAVSPSGAVAASVVIGALTVAWLIRARLMGRHADEQRMIAARARERRGF